MQEASAAFSKAKAINAGRIRYDIGGGAFSLVCTIDFPRRVVFVKFVGTQAEYDDIDAATVARFQELTMDIRPIRSKEDHRAALQEIDRLWGAPEGSDEGDKLDILVTLVERYEEANFALPRSSPLDVLSLVMRENGYTQADLAALLGSRSRASEILGGKRALTLDQIRLLQRRWHIPAGALIGEFTDA